MTLTLSPAQAQALQKFLDDRLDDLPEFTKHLDHDQAEEWRGIAATVREVEQQLAGVEEDRTVTTGDGRAFDAVEIAACMEWADPHGELVVERVDSKEEWLAHEEVHYARLIWSVYGHLVEGGVDCIADCPRREDAQFVGQAVATAHQLPVDDYTFGV